MRLLILLALICAVGPACPGAGAAVVDVTRVNEPLVANDASKAEQNTKRIARIMESVPAGGAVYFPAGDYYFHGSARTSVSPAARGSSSSVRRTAS